MANAQWRGSYFNGGDLEVVGEGVFEVVEVCVRAACKGGGGLGPKALTEPPGLGYGKHILGGLVFDGENLGEVGEVVVEVVGGAFERHARGRGLGLNATRRAAGARLWPTPIGGAHISMEGT